eukprot:2667536-Prymnesium_polylepis.1
MRLGGTAAPGLEASPTPGDTAPGRGREGLAGSAGSNPTSVISSGEIVTRLSALGAPGWLVLRPAFEGSPRERE